MELEQARAPSIGVDQRPVRGMGWSSNAPSGVVTSFILEGLEEPKTSEPVDKMKFCWGKSLIRECGLVLSYRSRCDLKSYHSCEGITMCLHGLH